MSEHMDDKEILDLFLYVVQKLRKEVVNEEDRERRFESMVSKFSMNKKSGKTKNISEKKKEDDD